jgi:hypothetical protein
MKKTTWIARGRIDSPVKKLILRKDYVRILTSNELQVVAGGGSCVSTESEHTKGSDTTPTTC